MPNNMLKRSCRQCGQFFLGGPRAWYCPKCRSERARDANKKFKERKRMGDVVPLGSIIICPDCGKEFVKTGGNSTRCIDCAKKTPERSGSRAVPCVEQAAPGKTKRKQA